MVFTLVHVCIISYPLVTDTAAKVKVPKFVPKHNGLAPMMEFVNPQHAFAVVQPDTLPGALLQPLHI
jgi:hypothetical protein